MEELQSTSWGPCCAQVLDVRADLPYASALGITETIRFSSEVFLYEKTRACFHVDTGFFLFWLG